MKTIITTKEQAAEIVWASQDIMDSRPYWHVVADVMGLDRNANFTWKSCGSSSTPDLENKLIITITE